MKRGEGEPSSYDIIIDPKSLTLDDEGTIDAGLEDYILTIDPQYASFMDDNLLRAVLAPEVGLISADKQL